MKLMRIFKRVYLSYLKRVDEVKYWKALGVKIGEGTRFYNAMLDYGHPWMISIGKNCILTNCRILTHDASTYSFLNKSKVSDVIVGDNVFIGVNSIILCGVHVGDNSIIGAGSVVSKDVPANVVVAGNPAKIVCTKEEFEKKHLDAYSTKRVWTTHYKDKDEMEKNEMWMELLDDFGYDV